MGTQNVSEKNSSNMIIITIVCTCFLYTSSLVEEWRCCKQEENVLFSNLVYQLNEWFSVIQLFLNVFVNLIYWFYLIFVHLIGLTWFDYYSGYCDSTSLGFGCVFFPMSRHVIIYIICQTERCKYAYLTPFFIRFPDLCIWFGQAVRQT